MQKQKQKQSVSQFVESQFHKKLTQLLLSVSVFSLFFSYCLSLLHSLNFTFHDTLAFKFFSHNIDKNFIFLLCNGLLVFLAKYSELISSSSSKHNLSDDHHQSFKSYEYVPQTESTQPTKIPKEDALETKQEDEENAGFVEEDLKGSIDDPFVEDIEESENYAPEEEEELVVEGNKVLSTEEMNKRFDEFIRKMKEELRIEARQQSIMV